jgi:hypothetical protein
MSNLLWLQPKSILNMNGDEIINKQTIKKISSSIIKKHFINIYKVDYLPVMQKQIR